MEERFITSALNKAQLLTFLGVPQATKITKQQLVTQLLELIATNVDEKNRLLDMFPQELAVSPFELEELLGCTKDERQRWVKEGKLPVLEYRHFRKGGQDLEYSVHERKLILTLSQDTIAQWRAEHQEQVRVHRKAGVQKAARQKQVNQQARRNFLAEWQQTVATWRQHADPELVAVLVLSFWTVWASRWAKENQVKSRRARKYTTLYLARSGEWYERKDQALHLLARTPYVQVSFYRPIDPDKRYLWLCEEHYELKREGYYEDIWDFFYTHAAMIKQCPDCTVQQEKDYYSLYYLEVATQALADVRFSFHLPYPLGKTWLPKPNELRRVEHMEQEGMFRFGRALFPNEKVIYREQEVLTHFQQALAIVQAFYPVEQPDSGALVVSNTHHEIVEEKEL